MEIRSICSQRLARVVGLIRHLASIIHRASRAIITNACLSRSWLEDARLARLRRHASTPPYIFFDMDDVEGAFEAAVTRVATYIVDHPDAYHTHQDLADLAAMNKRAFSRVFRIIMGMSVKAFVRSVRVARAKYLIDQTDLSIAQVMRRSGFASADAGRRAFLLVEGDAPTCYRRRVRP